jgi:Raf kinase inhibitor-like YbhB/YbcL family protein
MLSSTQLVSKRLGGCSSLLGLGGLLLVACSSDEGTPSNPMGTAGNPPVAGVSGGGAAGSTSTGGMGTAGSAGAGGNGQSGSSAGGGGSSAAGGGAGGAGGSGGAAGGAGGSGGAGGVNNAPFELKSPAFEEGEEVPLKYKCAEVNPVGENISPPLTWGPGPAGTKSYAIVMEHLPTPEHWVIWDIPANVYALPENVEHKAQPAVPAGSKQSYVNGLDGFTGSGYLGPCPQAVNSRQNYKFTLYALDVETLPGLGDQSSPGQAANVVKQNMVDGSEGKSLTGTQIRTN